MPRRQRTILGPDGLPVDVIIVGEQIGNDAEACVPQDYIKGVSSRVADVRGGALGVNTALDDSVFALENNRIFQEILVIICDEPALWPDLEAKLNLETMISLVGLLHELDDYLTRYYGLKLRDKSLKFALSSLEGECFVFDDALNGEFGEYEKKRVIHLFLSWFATNYMVIKSNLKMLDYQYDYFAENTGLDKRADSDFNNFVETWNVAGVLEKVQNDIQL